MVLINKIVSKFVYDELPRTFAVFYSVGVLLYLFPMSRDLFLSMIPLSLLFVFTLVLIQHKHWNRQFFIFLITVYFVSYFTEVIGVKSGILFGEYVYLNSLGPKLFETPLIIGVNWIMLTYCSAAVMEYLRRRFVVDFGNGVKIVGGATLMVTYDVIVERVAPSMAMWSFSNGYPPAENYISWFVLSLVFHILFISLNIKPVGKPAIALFFLQMLFFFQILVINLINNL